jgi:thiamine-phosphate pyrophosphorylase
MKPENLSLKNSDMKNHSDKKNPDRKTSRLEEIDFYLVTDSGLSRKGTLSDVKEAVEAGCKIVQYREKNRSTREMISEAAEIKRICIGE